MNQFSTKSEIQAFHARFEHCYDSLIHRVDWVMPIRGLTSSLAVTIETRDNEADGGWSIVRIVVEDILSWSFSMPVNSAYYLISDGLNLDIKDGIFYMDLGHYVDPPANVEEYRQSEFHIIGRRCTWEVTPME